ncbi:uncharacterized protein LOC100883742 isoform X2 [Megachile rotundata]|uniref:uncharacterized protein LOC100883742 isoform X2 n=1 Tax=Megachile rotundata TaxID=143995 RepID=UPI003FD6690D
MSQYSTDSLEDANEISPRSQDSLRENSVNLQTIKAVNDLSRDASHRTKRTTTLLTRKQDTRSNETTSSIGISKDTETVGSRNAIIANGDTSKRRRPVSSKNRKRDVTDPPRKNDTSKQDQEDIKKMAATKCTRLKSKQTCCKKTSIPMKPDKNLSNVAPKMQQSELYLDLDQRFSVPWYNARSPKGSTLSVWGDSHQEQLTDDETRSFATPRDDQSELSFYRRLIEGSNDPLAPTIRSSETVHQRELQDTNILSFSLDERVKQLSGDKSKKSVGYRPYTIEEYKTLSIPKLDRSLGPDKVEMQAKREWLMRRRSYGNSVSARNCQRILMQAQKLKTQDDSMSSMITEGRATSKDRNANCSRYSKRNQKVGKISSPRSSKKFERTSSFCSSLNSRDFIEDSYLESLRQRHLYEKEMVDRIINRALCS